VVVTGDGLLAGRVALVTGGAAGIGRELALGLADAGATVATTGGFASRADADAAVAVANRLSTHGAIDVVVHAHVDPDALVDAPLAQTDVATWARRCEALLYEALWCSQAAFATFADATLAPEERGGHLVFVTPTIGVTGVDGLVPYATAVEGIRALAKSAARQWGEHGIRVNCIAPPVEAVAPELGVSGPTMVGELSLGRQPDARTDIAPVVALLTSDAAHFVTGATIVVDGGVLMVP
jgi:NAD(P)-dependent dehydrogenase (short-subunit alcohol dehydrogenase family)